MSDNLRRYGALQAALKSLRPTEPQGNVARHLNTLAMLMAGIVGSRKCHLPAVAKKVPTGSKPQSRVRRLERFLANDAMNTETYYLPYVQCLLQSLPAGPLALVIDASQAGRGCLMLSINVVYHKRALPLCWLVVPGQKGHLAEETHIGLVEKVVALLPPERTIVFLGDGEFDGVDLLARLERLGWSYVCRTARNVVLAEASERFQPTDLFLEPGDHIELPEVGFTAAAYGPVLLCIIWEPSWQEPLLRVSNLDFLEEAYPWYRRRFRIETFYSDQKSRGFYLAHSHVSAPAHLGRLLIGTCLAYLGIVCLGAWVVQTGRLSQIHRADRCDWSLFHIGLNWVEQCLNEGLPLDVFFDIHRGGG